MKSTPPVAQTSSGSVSGEMNGGVARFRGIPFADSFAGARRFSRPRPPARWDGIRPCLSWAPMTPQVPDRAHVDNPFYADYLFGRFYPLRSSEDGLFLNLWTPSLDIDAKRPVVVWLHGGGFTTGVATRPREEASLLAKRGDIVVVAPTHRLGVFGYGWLAEEPRVDATPNAGLLDIVLALIWVQENIRNFGGDPDNVTIMGESGGGMKVSCLMAMPSAMGLFHRAVCLGGTLVKGHTNVLSTDDARLLTRRLCEHLKVRTEDLATLPAATLISGQVETDSRPLTWRPVIDGTLLTDYPDRVISSGSGAAVPLLIGSAAHEAEFLSKVSSAFDVRTPSDMVRLVGERAIEIAETYVLDDAGLSLDDHKKALAMLTDYYMRIPSILMAEAHASAGRKSFMYLFDWIQPNGLGLHSTHGAETGFVFGNLEATGFTRGFDEAQSVSRQVQDGWIDFFRFGDPGHTKKLTWPAYAPEIRHTMVFRQSANVESDPRQATRIAWS